MTLEAVRTLDRAGTEGDPTLLFAFVGDEESGEPGSVVSAGARAFSALIASAAELRPDMAIYCAFAAGISGLSTENLSSSRSPIGQAPRPTDRSKVPGRRCVFDILIGNAALPDGRAGGGASGRDHHSGHSDRLRCRRPPKRQKRQMNYPAALVPVCFNLSVSTFFRSRREIA